MKLITAHRILISTAVAFFFGFALWEFRSYLETGNPWSTVRSLVYFAVSLSFAYYLKNLKRYYR